MKVGFVACSSSKLTRAAPAWQLYTSPLFRLSVAYLTQKVGVDRWYVLSAKHGLVAPETVLEPYDETLTKMGKAERQAWGERVAEQIYAEWRKCGIKWDITTLAGATYCQPLQKALLAKTNPRTVICALRFDDPLHGKAIGERLQWLSSELGRDDKAARKAEDLDELMGRVKWHSNWNNAEHAVVDGVPVAIAWNSERWCVEVKSLLHPVMLASAKTKEDARMGGEYAARTRRWLVTGFPPMTLGVAQPDSEEVDKLLADLTRSTRRLGPETVKEMGLEKLAETLGITWSDE